MDDDLVNSQHNLQVPQLCLELTFAPCLASAMAVAAPMPVILLEPVTMAVLPLSVCAAIFSRYVVDSAKSSRGLGISFVPFAGRHKY